MSQVESVQRTRKQQREKKYMRTIPTMSELSYNTQAASDRQQKIVL